MVVMGNLEGVSIKAVRLMSCRRKYVRKMDRAGWCYTHGTIPLARRSARTGTKRTRRPDSRANGHGTKNEECPYPVIPRSAPVSRRTQTEPQQDINTCVGEYTSRGDLSLESLSDLRNRSDFANCFNLDILTRSDEDSQLLMGAGFRMVGSAQKSEQGEMVLYRRWRLNLRGE